VMQQGCCVEFDSIVTAHLKKHLSSGAVGGFSDDKRKDITDEIFEELSRTAKDKDADVPVRVKITDAILREYPENADMLARFNSAVIEDIFSKSDKLRHDAVSLLTFSNQRMCDEIDYLKSIMKSLLSRMLEERQAECYEDGMVGELKQKLTGALDSFSKEKLHLQANEKLKVHVWTLQQFHQRMEDMQAAWDKKNKSSSVLEENKERYIQTINARLEYGFTCAAEGNIIGQHLLKVIKQKAIDAENTEIIQAVKDLVWTTNSEKVRLKYFERLAVHVKDGWKSTAVEHFLDPTEEIETWYKTTVDQYRSETFGKMFTSTFEKEFKSVLQKVENAVDCNEVVSVAQKYSAILVSLYYKPSSDFEAKDNDTDVLKDEIVKIMKENKNEFCSLDDSLFSLPSADSDVMSRLGCTHTCFWCGALCWGQRGHDKDQGETRKHHSSHQPSGLHGLYHKHTAHLLSEPCHDRTDDSVVYWGNYSKDGIKWHLAKENHFSEWKFNRHYNSKFDELMRWFFFELHQSISERLESTKPATEQDLKRHKCVNLSYNDIMARIKQEIN